MSDLSEVLESARGVLDEEFRSLLLKVQRDPAGVVDEVGHAIELLVQVREQLAGDVGDLRVRTRRRPDPSLPQTGRGRPLTLSERIEARVAEKRAEQERGRSESPRVRDSPRRRGRR